MFGLFWLNKIIQFIKHIVHLNVGWWVHVGSTAVFAMFPMILPGFLMRMVWEEIERIGFHENQGKRHDNFLPEGGRDDQ